MTRGRHHGRVSLNCTFNLPFTTGVGVERGIAPVGSRQRREGVDDDEAGTVSGPLMSTLPHFLCQPGYHPHRTRETTETESRDRNFPRPQDQDKPAHLFSL